MDLLLAFQRWINTAITADLSAFAATRTWAALGRGVPEAGLTFAFAMMLGVGLTLGLVALLSVMARDRLRTVLAHDGPSLERIGRSLDALAGVVLVVIGVRELLR